MRGVAPSKEKGKFGLGRDEVAWDRVAMALSGREEGRESVGLALKEGDEVHRVEAFNEGFENAVNVYLNPRL